MANSACKQIIPNQYVQPSSL